MRAQFNVRIGKSTLKRVASDRKFSAATNDIIAEVALENWFTKYTPEQRKEFYQTHKRKPFARV